VSLGCESSEAPGNEAPALCTMRIYQDEIYQKGAKFIRIVRLDRYEVEFKTMNGEPKGEGHMTVLPKKEFCRLLKGMSLLPPVKKDAPKE
jgi:hypothetical protein